MPSPAFIFDFDSTLVSVESLDELLEVSVRRREKGSAVRTIMGKIHAITDEGMEGGIDLRTSISRRLALARPTREDLRALEKRMNETVTKGMDAIIRTIHAHGGSAFVVSGAIHHLIEPVAHALGIPDDHSFGNEPVFDSDDVLIDVKDRPLATSRGKTDVIRSLIEAGVIDGPVIMIGDGASDLHPFLTGVADHFIGVGIHAVRSRVEMRSPVFVRTVHDLHQAIRSFLPL
ncbi:MAG: HAD-IB family phosphatase [Candidatus Peribacteraceae bacterium]|nr:HAD-IB family phosphatase [Candidatus Peribacteraceae bacterium]